MKKVILSFDYELFFGDKSGTVLKSIIEPTAKMLEALESLGAKANFFVDWQMLKYMRDANTEHTTADFLLIKTQLQDLIKKGHRIELHIHPHWVDAKYNGDGTWDFSNFEHYSLSSFSREDIERMFREGTELLNSIAQEVEANYKICAFRAGGWVLPEMSVINNAFVENGIIIDSSLGKGFYINDGYRIVDCTSMPSEPIYRMEESALKENNDGRFIEMPISTFNLSFIDRLYNKCYHIIKPNLMKYKADGTHKRSCDKKHYEKVTIISKIRNIVKPRINFLTLSHFAPPILIRKMRNSKSNLIVVIDHPKDFAESNLVVLSGIAKYCEFELYKSYLEEGSL